MNKKETNSQKVDNAINNDQIKTITISSELLTPIAIILSAVIISLSIFFSFKNINLNNVSGSKANTETTTTEQPTAQQPEAKPTVNIDQIKALFDGDGIKFGDKNRKLLFVEFSDPSCPYCHVAGGKNSELNKQIGQQFLLKADGGSYVAPVEEMRKLVNDGKASFVWKYTNGHGNGELATEALYCAYEKGKFWEAHDLLMSSSGYSLINDTVKNDRAQSGTMASFLKSAVDSDFMKGCLDSKKYSEKIASDQTTARSLGVSGTPGFFVNSTNFAGAYSYTDMESVVNSSLK